MTPSWFGSDRQEPINDITSLLVIHCLFDLFYFILVTKITFYGLLQHPPSVSNGSTVHACRPQMSFSACLLHFACDLLRVLCLGAICGGASSISSHQGFSAEVKSQDIQSGQTQPYFRWQRETCAHSHSNTHTSRHTGTCLSAHTQTEEGGGGGEVAG